MVLGDFFRDLFSKNKTSDDEKSDFGVTGLPRNIEDDLAKHGGTKNGENRKNQDTWQNESQDGFPNFSICIGPGCDSRSDDEFFQMEQNMMQQLEDMMQGFFRGFNGHDFMPDLPQIQGPETEQSEDERNGQQSLRDKMLKDHKSKPFGSIEDFQVIPFHHGSDDDESKSNSMMDWSWTFPFGGFRQREKYDDFKDKDFDTEVETGKSKLDDIIGKEGEERQRDVSGRSKNGSFSFQKYSSITTKRGADGIVESQKTVRDSEGNEETTVIRRIGDQEHKKTIKKDVSGNEETNENLVNMDEGDLEKFEDAWIRSRSKGDRLKFPESSDSNIDNIMSGRLQDSLWGYFFPWKRN